RAHGGAGCIAERGRSVVVQRRASRIGAERVAGDPARRISAYRDEDPDLFAAADHARIVRDAAEVSSVVDEHSFQPPEGSDARSQGGVRSARGRVYSVGEPERVVAWGQRRRGGDEGTHAQVADDAGATLLHLPV